MIKNLTTLNTAIETSALIDNWGKECINKTDQEIPYGIGVSDGQENIFSATDSFSASGYMYLDDLLTTNINGQIGYQKNIIINVFQAKSNELMDSYQTAIDLHQYLTQRKYDVSISLNKSVKCEFCYFAFLTVNLRTFPTCT
jgi:hypothetical protein